MSLGWAWCGIFSPCRLWRSASSSENYGAWFSPTPPCPGQKEEHQISAAANRLRERERSDRKVLTITFFTYPTVSKAWRKQRKKRTRRHKVTQPMKFETHNCNSWNHTNFSPDCLETFPNRSELKNKKGDFSGWVTHRFRFKCVNEPFHVIVVLMAPLWGHQWCSAAPSLVIAGTPSPSGPGCSRGNWSDPGRSRNLVSSGSDTLAC